MPMGSDPLSDPGDGMPHKPSADSVSSDHDRLSDSQDRMPGNGFGMLCRRRILSPSHRTTGNPNSLSGSTYPVSYRTHAMRATRDGLSHFMDPHPVSGSGNDLSHPRYALPFRCDPMSGGTYPMSGGIRPDKMPDPTHPMSSPLYPLLFPTHRMSASTNRLPGNPNHLPDPSHPLSCRPNRMSGPTDRMSQARYTVPDRIYPMPIDHYFVSRKRDGMPRASFFHPMSLHVYPLSIG